MKKILLIGLLHLVASYANAQTTVTLQPDMAGIDAMTSSANSSTNYGNDPSLVVARTSTDTRRIFIKFDLSSLPASHTIVSAQLSLWNNPTSTFNGGQHMTTGGPNITEIYLSNNAWNEQTITNISGLSGTGIASIMNLIPVTASPNQDLLNFDVKPLIINLYNNPSNNGIYINCPTLNTALVLASSDHPDPLKRPKLVITYQCPTTTVSNIYANGNPSYIGNVCVNSSIPLNAKVYPNAAYQWKRNGSNAIGAGSTSPNYNTSNEGIYTCDITIAGCTIQSNSLTAAKQVATVITNDATYFCTGSAALSFTINNLFPGTTYQWRKNGVAISGATSGSYSATTTGRYSCLISSAYCTSPELSDSIAISAGVLPLLRLQSSVTGNPNPINMCPGNGINNATITLVDRTKGNGTSAYTGDGASTCTFFYNNNVTQQQLGTSLFSVYQSGYYDAFVNTGCGTAWPDNIIAIHNTSSGPDIADGNMACGSKLLGDFSSSYPWNSYQWKRNGIYIPGATQSTYNATQSGNYSCIFNNGCDSVESFANITIHPNTATITSLSTDLCTASSITLTANTGSGITYQWQLNGSNITGANASNYTATLPGTYRCIEGMPFCGSKTSNSITLTGGNVSLVTLTGTAGFCRPSTGNIYSVPLQTGATYTWTAPIGATIVSGQGTNSINVSYAANAAAGLISVTVSNSCGSTSASLQTIIRSGISSTPGTITGSNIGCNGDVKSYTIRKVNNADYYIWTPPPGATINGSTAAFTTVDTGVVVTYGAAFTGDSLRVRSGNCKGVSTERRLRINKTNPATPGAISGTINGNCNQSNKLFSINAVNNATSYTWRTNIAGATINGNASPVTVTTTSVNISFTTFVSGQIYVKANNSCGSSAERSLTVYARPDIPVSITGPVSVCDGQTGVTYSTALVTNASSYNWTSVSGSSITSGQGTNAITINFGPNPLTGNVRVRAQNSCANSSYRNLSVTVNNCPRISSSNNNNALSIMPNPFTETATLYIPEDISITSDICIYNMLGSEVRKIKPEGNEITILKDDLPEGIYILKCRSDESEYLLRFVIR